MMNVPSGWIGAHVRQITRFITVFVGLSDQALTRPAAVGRSVLHAVGNPEIIQAGMAQGLADAGTDLAAPDAVLDPKRPSENSVNRLS